MVFRGRLEYGPERVLNLSGGGLESESWVVGVDVSCSREGLVVLVVEAGELVVGGVVVAGGGVVGGVVGLVAGVAGVGGVTSEHMPGLAGGEVAPVAGRHIAAVAIAHPMAHPMAHPVATVLAVDRGRVDRGGRLDHRLVGQGLGSGGRQGQGQEQEHQHGGGLGEGGGCGILVDGGARGPYS